jgi:hypothetical protein
MDTDNSVTNGTPGSVTKRTPAGPLPQLRQLFRKRQQ